jgi:4-amino-4-deoxy-L-arabinose transferase-like glycosyltransferase
VLRPPLARSFAAVRIELVVFAAIVAFLAANLPYLQAWPTAHNDEARELNAFWIASGADSQARPLDPEFGPDPLYKGGLQGFTVGLALRLAGLGLFQGRFVSLVWGGVLLMLVYLVGHRLYGPLAGALAALFLAISSPFLLASHMVRPDIVLAAMLAAALYLELRAIQERRTWMHLAAGLVLGLALDVHLNAIAFMPLVGLVYVARVSRFWRDRGAHLFAAGAALGALYFLLIRVASDPAQFARSSDFWIGIDKRPPILSGDVGWMLASELGRFEVYFTEDRHLELAVLIGALLLAAWQSARSRRLDPLLVGLAAAFILFVLIVSGKSEFYVVLFYPWLALLLAGGIVRLLDRLPTFRLPLAAVVAAASLVVFGVADNYDDLETAAGNFPSRGYYALVDEIRPFVPPGASILAPPLYWIGLHDHPYTDYYVWERLRAERREPFSSYAARLRPDVIVLDAKSRHQVTINSPGYLESHAVLLTSIRHVGFDRVEVWKLS